MRQFLGIVSIGVFLAAFIIQVAYIPQPTTILGIVGDCIFSLYLMLSTVIFIDMALDNRWLKDKMYHKLAVVSLIIFVCISMIVEVLTVTNLPLMGFLVFYVSIIGLVIIVADWLFNK